MYRDVHISIMRTWTENTRTSMSELRKDLASYLRIANSGEQVVLPLMANHLRFGSIGAQNEITIDHLVAGGLVNKPLRDQSLGDPEGAYFR